MITQEEFDNLKPGDRIKMVKFDERFYIRSVVELSEKIVTIKIDSKDIFGNRSCKIKEDKSKSDWDKWDIECIIIEPFDIAIDNIKNEIGI